MEDKTKPVSATIATYNIRNTTDRYLERRELLKTTIFDAKADIMGLQEVAFGKGGQLDDLITTSFGNELYDQYNAETQMKFQELHVLQPDFRIDGNSFIVSKEFGNENGKVLKHETLHLGGCRVAQRLLVEFSNNIQVWIVNCHLHHIIEHGMIRQFQAFDIATWMNSATKDSANVILMGDFNAPPFEPAYETLKKFGFQSTYSTIHNEEPKKTFPTGLKAPFMDTDPDGTFDYIFYKGENVKPLTIKIFGDQAKLDDETIYPSDHYGLVADFEFAH